MNRTLNTTTSGVKIEDGIFELIDGLGYFGSPSRVDLNQSWVYPLSHVSACFDEGVAAWWAFTPTLRCVDGVLPGCKANEGDPVDCATVRTWGVGVLTNGVVDGTIEFVVGTGVETETALPNANFDGSR